MKKYRDKNWLQEKYWDEELTQQEIANITDVHPETIRDWMDRTNIPTRDGTFCRDETKDKYRDEEWLREKYIEEDRTMKEISIIADVSITFISEHINEFDIPISPDEGKEIDVVCSECGTNLVRPEYHQDREHHFCDHQCLCAYMRNGETLQCSTCETNIYRRKGKLTKNNENFCSRECYYSFIENDSDSQEFRKSGEWHIFSREMKDSVGNTCEYCNSDADELYTHHIYPVSMGGNPWDNEFIVLCGSCHYGEYRKWHPPQLEEYIS